MTPLDRLVLWVWDPARGDTLIGPPEGPPS